MNFTEKAQIVLNNCDLDFRAEEFIEKMLLYGAGFGIGIGLILFNYSIFLSVIAAVSVFIVFEALLAGFLLVTSNNRIAMIEDILPDFLTLMAGNIRSGLTPDRALLLSARKEFGPLTKEIDKAAKAAIAGKPFTEAFMEMTNRIQSEMFSKTVRLIVEGIHSGGNLAELLDNTALDIRKFSSIRKEISATVLVYKLFMFAAAAFGGPLLYAISNFMIELVAGMRSEMIRDIPSQHYHQLPLVSGGSMVAPELVFWFSIFAVAITAFFASLAAGVISKGKESEGFPYIPLVLVASFAVFFGGKFIISLMLGGIFQ